MLAKTYPTADEWRKLVTMFSPTAIAHKLLLAHIPYVFRDEPLKFALFRRIMADAFKVEPSSVFIVGSAMAGRSLKGAKIDQVYSPKSDIDTLIVSEHLFARYVMDSLTWLRDATMPKFEKGKKPQSPTVEPEVAKHMNWLSMHACKGIWRPDSLPPAAEVRNRFFNTFADVSLKTLGLQLSEDTVARVNGRIARSFEDAVDDLAASIHRLRREFEGEELAPEELVEPPPEEAGIPKTKPPK